MARSGGSTNGANSHSSGNQLDAGSESPLRFEANMHQGDRDIWKEITIGSFEQDKDRDYQKFLKQDYMDKLRPVDLDMLAKRLEDTYSNEFVTQPTA